MPGGRQQRRDFRYFVVEGNEEDVKMSREAGGQSIRCSTGSEGLGVISLPQSRLAWLTLNKVAYSVRDPAPTDPLEAAEGIVRRDPPAAIPQTRTGQMIARSMPPRSRST